MSQSKDTEDFGTSWSTVAGLLLLAVFFGILAYHQDNNYFQSVFLEVSASIGLFIAIQVLLGRDVEEEERFTAYLVGFFGAVVTVGASLLNGFFQSLAIELGMGACLFCLLDVFIIDKLKLKAQRFSEWMAFFSLFREVDEEERERMANAFYRWYSDWYSDDGEPGDIDSVGFGGLVCPEDHERYMEWAQENDSEQN